MSIFTPCPYMQNIKTEEALRMAQQGIQKML